MPMSYASQPAPREGRVEVPLTWDIDVWPPNPDVPLFGEAKTEDHGDE